MTQFLNGLDPPHCIRCHSTMRLLSLEPDPSVSHADIRTFRCEACGEQQITFVPFAHDLVPSFAESQ